MNVEIGTDAAPFPEKEYINGIFVAVRGGENDSVGTCWGGRGQVNNQECEAQETGDQGAGSAKKTGLKSYENFKVAITLTLSTLFYTHGSGIVVLHVTVHGNTGFPCTF